MQAHRSRIDLRDWVPELVWRGLLLGLAASAILGSELVIETWLLPVPSAALAVQQLEPSDAAAESLRLFEALRGLLPVLSATLILVIGLVLFVPGVPVRIRRLRDSLEL